MENNTLVQSFAFQSTNVRVIEINNDPWFVLGDVLNAIASSTPVTVAVNSVIKALGEGFNDVKPLKTSGGMQNVTVVHEAAVTTLISRSETEMGRAFNRHLHSVILPTIRKTGKFVAHPESVPQPRIDNTLAIRKIDLQIDIKRLELQKLELQREDYVPPSYSPAIPVPIQTELPLDIEQRYKESQAALLAAKTLENEAKAKALTNKFAPKAKPDIDNLIATDSVAAWLNESVVLDPKAKTYVGKATGNPDTHLYPNYVTYCKQHRLELINIQRFSRHLMSLVEMTLEVKLGKGKDGVGCHVKGVAIGETKNLLMAGR